MKASALTKLYGVADSGVGIGPYPDGTAREKETYGVGTTARQVDL